MTTQPLDQQWLDAAAADLEAAREESIRQRASDLKREAEAHAEHERQERDRQAERARVVALAGGRVAVLRDAETTAVKRLTEALDAIEIVVREGQALAGLARELGATADDVRDLQQVDPLVEWVIGSLARRWQRETGRLAGHDIRHAAGAPRSAGLVKGIFQRLGVDGKEFKAVAPTGDEIELVAAREFRCNGRSYRAGDVLEGINEERIAVLVRTGHLIERAKTKKSRKRR